MEPENQVIQNPIETPKTSKSFTLWLVLGFVIVVLLGAIYFVYFNGQTKNSSSQQSTTAINSTSDLDKVSQELDQTDLDSYNSELNQNNSDASNF